MIFDIVFFLKKMSKLFIVKFKEEKSHHDGYCSDKECDYSTRIYRRAIEIPNKVPEAEWMSFAMKSADKLEVEGDSMFCDSSEESVTAGLARHTGRVTIIAMVMTWPEKKTII